jgi:hypothetical protein
MMGPIRFPSDSLRRVIENAALLILASLLVMSVALGRYSGALVWCGALMVFFAHAWESRVQRRAANEPAARHVKVGLRGRHFDALRWVGILLACSGALAFA